MEIITSEAAVWITYMGENLTKKNLDSYLVSGEGLPGQTIALSVDQTLFQHGTGTKVLFTI